MKNHYNHNRNLPIGKFFISLQYNYLMKINYHSHTIYCNHSIFTIEELIKKAISKGFTTFGISEHMNNPGVEDSDWRIKNAEELENYITEAQMIKEKYKDKINVLVGLECEITHTKTNESLASHLKYLHARKDIDFLILGHHTYHNDKHVYSTKATRKELEMYVERFKEALDLDVFIQVAHPDGMFRGFGELTDDLIWAANEMASYAAYKKMPLGINANGLQFGDESMFKFPNIEFWKIVANHGGIAILELDAHDHGAFRDEYINGIKKIAKDSGVTLIDKIEL